MREFRVSAFRPVNAPSWSTMVPRSSGSPVAIPRRKSSRSASAIVRRERIRSVISFRLWKIRTSATWYPTRSTGFREDIGSWKTIEMPRPRIRFMRARCFFKREKEGTSLGVPAGRAMTRTSSSLPARRFRPRNQISPPTIWPGGCGMRYIIDRAVTVLPHPDSPTRPSTSPLPISKLTPSTARRTPRAVANSVFSPRTARIGSTLYLRARGSRTSRRPSPSKLTETVKMSRTSPGMKTVQGYDRKPA